MTLPYPDPDPKPALQRKCIGCGAMEHRSPGPWIDRGRFQHARPWAGAELPPVALGPLCPTCATRQPKPA